MLSKKIYYTLLFTATLTAAPFTDNANGTVTDQATGLIWQKCTAGLSGTSCSSGSATTYNWSNALSYCNSLTLASKTWRLPSINEIRTILDLTRTTIPLADVTAFPATVADIYWSSSTYAPITTRAWSIPFNTTFYSFNDKTNSTYVRCVSGP